MRPGAAAVFPGEADSPPPPQTDTLVCVDDPNPCAESETITEAICILGYD